MNAYNNVIVAPCRSVRRNIFHLVIVADPAAPECRDMFKFAESFYIHR